jgi:hypothetical protein
MIEASQSEVHASSLISLLTMMQGYSAVQLCPHDICTKLVLRDDIQLFMLWAPNTNLSLQGPVFQTTEIFFWYSLLCPF